MRITARESPDFTRTLRSTRERSLFWSSTTQAFVVNRAGLCRQPSRPLSSTEQDRHEPPTGSPRQSVDDAQKGTVSLSFLRPVRGARWKLPLSPCARRSGRRPAERVPSCQECRLSHSVEPRNKTALAGVATTEGRLPLHQRPLCPTRTSACCWNTVSSPAWAVSATLTTTQKCGAS